MSFRLFYLTALLASAATLPAATIIRADTPNANGQPNTNQPIPATFGDNITANSPAAAPFVFETLPGVGGVTGTPDINLTWSATGGTNNNRWESHTWGGAGSANTGGGVLQMDGAAINSQFSITFTPGNATTAVVLNSFNFVGDTDSDGYQYRVDIVGLTLNTVVLTSTTVPWTTSTSQNPGNTNPDLWAGAPAVLLNFTGEAGVAYRLDLVRTGTPTGASSPVDIAIDNLSFDQIPEPSIALLTGLGALALSRRRR